MSQKTLDRLERLLATLGEPDALKGASHGSEGWGWCPWLTKARPLTLLGSYGLPCKQWVRS
jgi:hypothetical protein